MSEIRIERQHKLGAAEAQKRVVAIEPKLKEKYGVKLAWNGQTADVKGTGVTGTLSVDDTQLKLDLKLGMLMRPMAGKIREALEHQIDKALV